MATSTALSKNRKIAATPDRTEFIAEIQRELRVWGYTDHATDSDYLRAFAESLLDEYLQIEEIEFGDTDFDWDAHAARTVTWEMELSVD